MNHLNNLPTRANLLLSGNAQFFADIARERLGADSTFLDWILVFMPATAKLRLYIVSIFVFLGTFTSTKPFAVVLRPHQSITQVRVFKKAFLVKRIRMG
jgi:hypothetical protein